MFLFIYLNNLLWRNILDSLYDIVDDNELEIILMMIKRVLIKHTRFHYIIIKNILNELL